MVWKPPIYRVTNRYPIPLALMVVMYLNYVASTVGWNNTAIGLIIAGIILFTLEKREVLKR